MLLTCLVELILLLPLLDLQGGDSISLSSAHNYMYKYFAKAFNVSYTRRNQSAKHSETVIGLKTQLDEASSAYTHFLREPYLRDRITNLCLR